MHFRANMARFLVPKIKEKHTYHDPKWHQTIDRFLINVLSILAPFWEPTWGDVGHLFRPKTAQEASKTPPRRLQDGPRRLPRRIWEPEPTLTPKMAPKWRPDPPKWCPKAFILNRIWRQIWICLNDFSFLGKRGGGLAALRRFGSAPGPKAPMRVWVQLITLSLSLSLLSPSALTLCIHSLTLFLIHPRSVFFLLFFILRTL